MHATKIAILTLLAACGFASLAPVRAAETFAYRLLSGKSTLRYSTRAGDEFREIYAGVSGTLQFVLNDDDTITATAFDLTIEGPFYDGVLAPPDSTPFAPGDKLADYLTVDLASAAGFQFTLPTLNGEPGPPRAVVGPQAEQDGAGSVVLGQSYYALTSLDANPTALTLEALARTGVGGTFQISPETELFHGPFDGGDVQVPQLRFLPNVARIPEPAAAAIALPVLLAFVRRRTR